MTDQNIQDLSFDEYDELRDPRPAGNGFDDVVEAAISRRGFMGGALVLGSGAMVMGPGAVIPTAAEAASRFGFKPVPSSTANTVTLPDGYNWQVLVRWGQPMWSGVSDVDVHTGGTGESQGRSFGDNTDGMALFVHGDKQVLAINNEYIQNKVLLKNRDGGMPANVDDANKIKRAHGVSVIEAAEKNGKWKVVVDSPYNRKITMETEMRLSGPAAGHSLLKTPADPGGTKVFGTQNNCANGRTPWGTYLTCEENFNGYFGSTDPDHSIPDTQKRYGIFNESRYGLERFDERFDLSKNPNEPHRFGYVVEIDPLDPNSTPVKRTALGRFKHENAELTLALDGRVVVYSGDDERGEFLYRYVSDNPFTEGGDNSRLLDEGTLYVAKFSEDLKGEWMPLTPATTGMDEAEIYIHTRQAASAVGATTMDRPEWITTNPLRAEAYCALTNNKNRGIKPNAGGDPTPVGGPNPREANNYGQIVRWRPAGGDHASDTFEWDLYVMSGNPDVHSDEYGGSRNVNSGNLFNSPDGLGFDSRGVLWIQTDGNFSNEGDFAGMGNNQMLAGDPDTGEIVRFMTGPKECEVTGLTWSADRRTMFVGIQHPGEDDNGAFPDGPGTLPRSCVIAIKRDDNAVIG